MNEEKDREIRKIKKKWKEENDSLEPINLPKNSFNNSVNSKRNEIANKYINRLEKLWQSILNRVLF